MDIEQTTEQQLLTEAKRQTAALESLRWTAMMWSAAVALLVVIWLIVLINGGR